LVRIARESHRVDVPGKNVADGWPKSLGFVLQPRKTQVPLLVDDTIDGINLFADVCARVLSQFCRAGSERHRGFKYARLPPAEALLHAAWLFRGRRQEMYVHFIAPGNIGNVKASLSGGLQHINLIATRVK